MPGKTRAHAGVVVAPPRRRAIAPPERDAARDRADVALDAWSRPDSWRWLEGRWALSGTVMGVPLAPPGDTLRLAVDGTGVTCDAGRGPARPVIVFGDDGRPAVRLDGLAGEEAPAALRAVAATRRSVVFQDVISAAGIAPAVLKVTLRRAGPNIFHVVGDTAVGPSPVPMLAYTALKLNGRG